MLILADTAHLVIWKLVQFDFETLKNIQILKV
jgi:hypothetical protein